MTLLGQSFGRSMFRPATTVELRAEIATAGTASRSPRPTVKSLSRSLWRHLVGGRWLVYHHNGGLAFRLSLLVS